MADRARYEIVLRPSNHASHRGVYVSVIAGNRAEAVRKAIAFGWNDGRDAAATVLRVEEVAEHHRDDDHAPAIEAHDGTAEGEVDQ